MKAYAQEALELSESLGDMTGIARASKDLGNAAVLEGDYERAERLFETCRAAALAANERRYVVIAMVSLGNSAHFQGRYERALAFSQEALALARELGHPETIMVALFNAGFAFFRLGRHDDARTRIKESLTLAYSLRSAHMIASCISLTGSLATARGDSQQAGQLLAMAEALQMELGVSNFAPEQELHDETAASLRERLDPHQLAKAQTAGQAMTLDEAVAYAAQSLS
ncbi:MAG: tetratricopeptide repeat protein [Actinomycetota bacterium]|nr:tetratricopeptide repeat protein [Actinomycetota bacterium]MDQ2980799.1 tetratricopeptide repeat protein [Actinomycetota bacterium]